MPGQKGLKVPFLAGIVIVLVSVFSASAIADEAGADKGRPTNTNQPQKAPSLSQLIPSAIVLEDTFIDLKKQVVGVSNISIVEKKLARISDEVDKISEQWLALKSVEEIGYDQLRYLRLSLNEQRNAIKEINESVIAKIESVDVARNEWAKEKERWGEWRISLENDMPISSVKTTFAIARQNIDDALDLTGQTLPPLLEIQKEVGQVQSRIKSLGLEMGSVFTKEWGTDVQETTPSFFSRGYYSQIASKALWQKVSGAFKSLSWPDTEYFVKHGWVILSQLALALILATGIFHQRTAIKKSEKWHFLATRPLSAAIFVGIMAFIPFYSQLLPPWNMILAIPAAVAFSRLIGGFVSDTRKTRLIYSLTAVFILTKFLQMLHLPLALFRLYVIFVALAGSLFCLWQGLRKSRSGTSNFYKWSLRLGAAIFLVILLAEAGGYSAFALRLFESSLTTIFLLLVYLMLVLLVRGALELALYSIPAQKISFIHNNASGILSQSVRIINLILGFFLLSVILSSWGLYAGPAEAIGELLSLGLTIGSLNISVGLIIGAAALLYGSFTASWAIQSILMDEVLPRRQVEKGIQISIARLTHYALVFLGFMLALMALGLELTNLTILGGAVGVGLGFGLQAIVNNFASGLILLFERPVKVGDTIEVGDQWGEIKKLGLRATVVQTYDNAEIVVPNSDLITNQVINWTLAERQIRIKIPVGVAYGSDVPLVIKILMESAEAHAMVLKEPAPRVLFMAFGESSLDFELRAWISDFNHRRKVQSELLQDIDQRFRQSNIEIPFPQRDLHFRSMDDAVASSLRRPSPY